MVGRADEDVVDVEQQAAAGAADDLGEEFGLGDRAVAELHVGRRVLEQHARRQRLLRLVDVAADDGQRLVVVGQRQQVGEEALVVARPGEVLGKLRRLVAADQALEPRQVVAVERPRRADRQPDPMQRQRIAGADRLQPAMRRPAVAHVGLGVDLEEADLARAGEDRREMLGLEADAGAARQGTGAARRGEFQACHGDLR